MDNYLREAFLDYSKSKEFAKKLKKAEGITQKAIKNYKTYVSYSGGKDSTVVLHLAISFKPDILVIHWDYGSFMPRKYFEELVENAKAIGAVNLKIYTSDTYKKLGRKALNVWGKEFFKRVAPQLKEKGYKAVLLGLRKEESPTRKRTVEKGRAIAGIKEFYPIGDWSYRDVWAYILSHNLPYHSTYDIYGPIIGWDKVRFVTFFDPQFEKFGTPYIDGVLSWKFRNIT